MKKKFSTPKKLYLLPFALALETHCSDGGWNPGSDVMDANPLSQNDDSAPTEADFANFSIVKAIPSNQQLEPAPPDSFESFGSRDHPSKVLADSLTTKINEGLALPELSTAQKISVRWLKETGPGASAIQSDRVIGLSHGLLDLKNEGVITILCHEIAHLTQNHEGETASQSHREPYKSAEEQVDNAIGPYLERNYDRSTSMLTWKKQEIISINNQIAPQLGILAKPIRHQEYMADAVGAMICATFGMSVDNFINATQEAFAVASSYSRPEPKDGERIQVPPTAVFRSVVQFDDHPSAQQRIGSLTRLKSIIAAKYNKNARIYSDLKQILDTQGAAARQANGRGPDPTTPSSTPVPSPGFPNSTPGSVTPPATFNDSN